MAEIRIEDLTVAVSDLSEPLNVFKFSEQKKSQREFVLKNLNLKIKHGETLSILGPSGCGKTTLLRFIAGLLHPKSGKIFFDGKDFTQYKADQRKIGMVFQNFALYPHYTSEGNLSFKFWMKKAPQPEINDNIKETAKLLGVGFEKLLNKMPKNLSAGEKQRVALGRCIIGNPSVFLLDEPISNLDAKQRVTTRINLKKLLSKFKITTVYVTHDQNEAIALGDRIMVMDREGSTKQVGTYRELYDNPSCVEVASFFGSPPMNIFNAAILNNPDFKATFAGIRPENVYINAKPSEPNISLKATITNIENLLSEQVILVYLSANNIELVSKIKEGGNYRKGDTAELFLPLSKIYKFDN